MRYTTSPKGYLNYNKNLTLKAKVNRTNPTEAEKKMWYEVLQNKKTGYKFLRQKPIRHFILDFYCSKLLLAIEIDGDTHAETEEYDQKRTKALESCGIKVIRYTNNDILQNTEGVYIEAMKQIRLREKSLRTPSNSPFSGGQGDCLPP